ncbi:MAG: hypothetical protein RH860_02200 [Cytophagales bacterium]
MQRILTIIVILLSVSSISKAQFEKKLTFDFSLGYAIPMGEDLREDRLPYFYSNMSSGFAFAADFQYNLNKKLSIGMRGEYTDFWSWYDPRSSQVDDSDESWITLISINPYARYKILDKKISPFVVVSAGATIYNGERSPSNIVIKDFYASNPESYQAPINEVTIRESGQSLNTTLVPNTMAGLGVQMDVSQFIGVFLQANYNLVFTNQDEVLRQNMQYVLVTGGVNLNFVKSKTL